VLAPSAAVPSIGFRLKGVEFGGPRRHHWQTSVLIETAPSCKHRSIFASSPLCYFVIKAIISLKKRFATEADVSPPKPTLSGSYR
jgi:hypothetical protein